VVEALEELLATIAIAVVLGGGAAVADAAAVGQDAADAGIRALVNAAMRSAGLIDTKIAMMTQIRKTKRTLLDSEKSSTMLS